MTLENLYAKFKDHVGNSMGKWVFRYQLDTDESSDQTEQMHRMIFVLGFYGPVNPMGSCQAQSVLPNHTFTGQA